MEELSNLNNFILVLAVYRNQNSSRKWERCLSSFLCFVECFSIVGRKTKYLTSRTHLRSEQRVNLWEHVEWEYSFLNTIVRNALLL